MTDVKKEQRLQPSQLPPVQAIHDIAAARLRSLLAEGETGAIISGNVVHDLTEIKRIAETLSAEDTHKPTQPGQNNYENDVPIVDDFFAGVRAEKAHQLRRWGTTHDRNKAPADWFWLLGYLGGKALAAAVKGDREKALHHCISSAAVLANWHDALKNDGTGFVKLGEGQSLKVEHEPSKALFENNPDATRPSDLEKHLGGTQ